MRYIQYALYLTLPLAAMQSWQVIAHHAFSAEFDKDAPVTLEGKVTKIEWINPHAWIHLDVIGEDGEAVAWMVEGGRRSKKANVEASVSEGVVVGGMRALERSRNRRKGCANIVVVSRVDRNHREKKSGKIF